MVNRLLLSVIVSLLCTVHAHAGVTIWFETEHDELGARLVCEKRSDIAKRQVMLERLERKLLDGLTSKDKLIEKYGDPKPFDIAKFVRPIGACFLVSPRNIRSNEIEGLMDRSLYFELNPSCGILVLYNPEGQPYQPSILLWKVDDNLPKMTDAALCDKRLEWESTRLEFVLKLARVSESDLTPIDKEKQ
jgi:hypothetical protein